VNFSTRIADTVGIEVAETLRRRSFFCEEPIGKRELPT
jgi:hypothetical protein